MLPAYSQYAFTLTFRTCLCGFEKKNFKGVVFFAIKQPSKFVMVYNFCNDCKTSIPVAFAKTVDETHFSVTKWINFRSNAAATKKMLLDKSWCGNEKNFIYIKRWRHDVWNVRLDRCVHLRKSSIDINKEARVLSSISAILAAKKKIEREKILHFLIQQKETWKITLRCFVFIYSL